MCGIYGLLSARDVSRAPGDELFCCVETFVQAGRVANLAETLADDSASEQLVARASELQAAAQYWTGRAASISVLTDLELSMRIEAAAAPGGEPLPSLHSSRYAPLPEPTLRTGVRSMANLALSLLAPASD